MIRKDYKRFKKYCCEDISLIENYDKAVNDTTQTWCCHHKLEIELLKKPSELIEMGLYFDRPASELIFLTRSEHIKLHNLYREYTDEWKEKLKKPKSKEHRKKLSEAAKRQFKEKGHPMLGKHMPDDAKKKSSNAPGHKSEETKAKLREAWVRRKIKMGLV